MFTINGHVMGITLEDVLYLLRLPVNGELVLVGENSHLSYKKFFGEDPKKVKISDLNRIVYNSTENKEKRMRALLLIIIWHFVMPTKNGDGIYPSLASLLENPYNTSSIHAWGAAVLAFLHGRKKKNKEGGNLWLVLAFFLVRIPKLWTILGVEITREELEELARVDYPLKWIMTRLEKVSKNTRVNYKGALRNALESLEDEDIHWRPYMTWELPGDLQSNIDWVRRVSPIFADNYVVHHAPHLLAKQFGLANNVKYTLYHIGMKDNRGSKSHNWTKKYEVHIAKWMNSLFLGDPPAVHRETTPIEDSVPHIQDDTETSPSREDIQHSPPLQLSPGSEDPPSSSREDPSSRISKVADPHAAHQEAGPDPPESFEPITGLRTPLQPDLPSSSLQPLPVVPSQDASEIKSTKHKSLSARWRWRWGRVYAGARTPANIPLIPHVVPLILLLKLFRLPTGPTVVPLFPLLSLSRLPLLQMLNVSCPSLITARDVVNHHGIVLRPFPFIMLNDGIEPLVVLLPTLIIILNEGIEPSGGLLTSRVRTARAISWREIMFWDVENIFFSML
ncbi:Unknown protein [Striga hermonthica]|uniref:Aminotransferase-like plant mobile domain-containing protein n=1 Tax=Striga hermonthica TaxID=68872 RepID=A0A9N7RK06_STRHE|nr:Unknown protein [Striga hermonthica]